MTVEAIGENLRLRVTFFARQIQSKQVDECTRRLLLLLRSRGHIAQPAFSPRGVAACQIGKAACATCQIGKEPPSEWQQARQPVRKLTCAGPAESGRRLQCVRRLTCASTTRARRRRGIRGLRADELRHLLLIAPQLQLGTRRIQKEHYSSDSRSIYGKGA